MVKTTRSNWIGHQNVVMACSGFHVQIRHLLLKTCHLILNKYLSEYKNPGQLGEGAVLVVGTGQSGTQIATELAESGRRVYACVGSRSLRVPRKVRGKDITWWLLKTGLYDTKITDLRTPEERKDKRFGPNPSQCPGRDVSLRNLCHKHGLTLLGKAKDVVGGDTLQLESANLPEYDEDRKQCHAHEASH